MNRLDEIERRAKDTADADLLALVEVARATREACRMWCGDLDENECPGCAFGRIAAALMPLLEDAS